MNNNEITADPRFNATGMGANDELRSLIRDHFTEEQAIAIGRRRTFLMNTDAWRASDAMRQAIREAATNLPAI